MSDLRLSVGYPCAAPTSFFDTIVPYLDGIGELYFALDGLASGRASFEDDPRYDGAKLKTELRRFADSGVRLNLLLNGNCYGGEALSQALAERVIRTVGELRDMCGLHTVTTASLLVAHVLKRAFPDIDVRASVNMWIDGISGMEQVADLFDSFYVKRDYHYCPDEIRAEHDWCAAHGKKLYLLANSGCLPHCAGHTFHDNAIAHSAAVAKTPRAAEFEPYVCRRLLADTKERYRLLSGNVVRPEDIGRYEGLVDGIKLATRIHPCPALVIGAYKRRRWVGDFSLLTEPGFGDLLSPFFLDNTAIPDAYWERRTTCARAKAHGSSAACRDCGYCEAVYKRILTPAE